MSYTSLESVIARGDKCVSPRVLLLLQHPLVEELMTIRDSAEAPAGRLSASSVELSDDLKTVRVTSASSSELENIKDYGALLLQALSHSSSGSKSLENIAQRCFRGELTSLEQAHLLIERMVSSTIYKEIIAIVVACLAAMAAIHYLWN